MTKHNYYNIIAYIPSTVLSSLWLTYNWDFVPFYPLHLFSPSAPCPMAITSLFGDFLFSKRVSPSISFLYPCVEFSDRKYIIDGSEGNPACGMPFSILHCSVMEAMSSSEPLFFLLGVRMFTVSSRFVCGCLRLPFPLMSLFGLSYCLWVSLVTP